MVKKVNNQSLGKARGAKQDEFYTQLGDISNELKHYKAQLRGKTIFCNCDDPFESNFFKYFALNFNALGLKKLIATSYMRSPIVGADLPLFSIDGLKPEGKEPYAIEINEVPDQNRDGAIDLADVEYLLKNNANTARTLKGDHIYIGGDFRSRECVELLKQSDIVITNPPFSLFREYVPQLVEYGKQFLIIGSKNAITCKEIFALVKQNKLWLGHGFTAGNAYFKIRPKMHAILLRGSTTRARAWSSFAMSAGSRIWTTKTAMNLSLSTRNTLQPNIRSMTTTTQLKLAR